LFTDKKDIYSGHTENLKESPTVCNCSNQERLVVAYFIIALLQLTAKAVSERILKIGKFLTKLQAKI